MIRVHHRTITITVRKEKDQIVSETCWIDSAREYVGVICAEPDSLNILDAWVEILKKPSRGREAGEKFISQSVMHFSFLQGTRAFIDGKKTLKDLFDKDNEDICKYLMEQCINGIIQAETYLYQERGFKNKEEYNEYWDRLEKNGCRMYSFPSPENLRWMDYVPQIQRDNHLFHRVKSVSVFKGDGRAVYRAELTDSYHEIRMELLCDKISGRIYHADISFFRAPGEVCFEAASLSHNLLGKNIYSMSKKEIIDTVGGGEGCYHLVEILKDIIEAVSE